MDKEIKDLLKRIINELRELKEEIYELKNLRRETLGGMIDSILQNVSTIVEREVTKVFKGFDEKGRRVVFYPFRKGYSFFVEVPSYLGRKESVEREVEETLKEVEREVKSDVEGEFERIEKFETLISDLNPSEVAETLSVLSNPDRLELLKLLYERDRYFGELEDILEIGPSSLRHHLSRLMDAGLVRQERSRGKYIITRRGIAALILSSYLHRRILRFGQGEDKEGDI